MFFFIKPTYLFKRFPSSLPFSTYSASNYFNCHLNLFVSNQTSTFQCLLQSHALIITTGNSNNVFVASKLISLYALLDKPTISTQVFSSVHHKDTFLWNSIIKSHFSNGAYQQALDFFQRMRASYFSPNQFTLPMVVATCTELGLVDSGKNLHGLASKLGLFSGNVAVGSSFVYMYSKCNQMEDASFMFEQIAVRDVVAWTALVIGYVQNDVGWKALEYLCRMHRIGGEGERPNFRTLEGGFQACGNLGALEVGRCLHCFAVKTGIGCSEAVKSSLLSMYSKCDTPDEAYYSFCEVINKDLLSWMSIISVHARSGSMNKCSTLFWEMLVSEINPDEIVISCMLLGFGNSMTSYEGKAFHGLITRRSYVHSDMIHNALLFMYCKFGFLTLAEKIFNRSGKWTKDTCSSLISGYNKKGLHAKCIELFREMQHQGIEADPNCLVSVISSCCQLGAVYLGWSLHCYVIKSSRDENILVYNSLIDMYGKSGNLTISKRIFDGVQGDTITWNTLISSYIENGKFSEAIAIFDKMISQNLNPNSATLVMVLSACSHLAFLKKGQEVHHYIMQRGLDINLSLATALVDMYSKCGQLEQSRELFDSMKEKDVISWNVMISGYGMHGHAKSAIEMFQEMEAANLKPNELTFLALLSACNHSGLVEEGKYLFSKMQDYSLKPNLKHYACMVDLLGRSGNLQEAEALAYSMPISPDDKVWGSLLSACNIHCEIEMGERVARHAMESDPENDGYYIMLSNMYSSMGRWEEAQQVRKLMKDKGVGKGAGWSVV
ncbi:pentatricopeptide repeat-containing protein At4g39952, mitochondrial [Ziziphus jujuba]|uniref:Pentatricopeptide repeat-containing protein At4g39952, mitochondrial n=1 Tax=Ziziphus jujuba TaxID=326968 RepID=A0ABM4AEG3_ZIZJJ|nr:pentatricopeptide repeat-containing protein At4g39952, mitochondrial [Ziziphus jujuba]XP_024932349.3 pentatricopeptide repeat-containing protein At4g39952, mitochondrial [Ziziphus jujuba]XP_024932351.3 pentatricopeptide repeat-containing protein At4g39952, mitochondrial [Ziziphus jujuba]XP_060675125.1 pentatricopeptide repeat-containing protein At4g39952, mitochondrial [Ziziphus jujuba]XP_060675126.1 pentatricopeptide repeat-containing protein At4g39952, mitochondrial [Ziziphus jujuba]XP_06